VIDLYNLPGTSVSLTLHHLCAVISYALKSVLDVIQVLRGMNMCNFTILFCTNQVIVNRVDDQVLYFSNNFPDDKLRDIQPNNYSDYYLY